MTLADVRNGMITERMVGWKTKDVRYCGIWPYSVTMLSRPEDLTLLLLEKESSKAIIVDIALPWDHRVYEKKGEKIDKY